VCERRKESARGKENANNKYRTATGGREKTASQG